MSINNTSSINFITQTASVANDSARVSSMKSYLGGINDIEDPKVKAKLEEFEGVFISQLLNSMFDQVEVDENFGGGFGEEITKSLLVNEYGKILAKSGGIGVADSVARQLLAAQQQTTTDLNQENNNNNTGEQL
jgi:Rod binding domain-containing protein